MTDYLNMKIFIIKLIGVLSMIIFVQTRLLAGIEKCGIDLNTPGGQELKQCQDRVDSGQSVRQQYECFLQVYENSIDELESQTINERSPVLRYFLTITRDNFQIGNEPNRLLNFYESTEIYRIATECQNNSVNIFKQNENGTHEIGKESCNFDKEVLDKAIEEARKVQSNHYALFEAGKKLNNLKHLLNPQVNRNFRNEDPPLAFNDCNNGYSPGAYPPQAYIADKQIKKGEEDELGCPRWVQDQTDCNTEKDSLERGLSKNIMIMDFFNLGVQLQLDAFAEQMLTKNPASLSTDYKIKVAEKVEQALEQCFEEGSLDEDETLADFKEGMRNENYFDQEGYREYEKMQAKDTANAIKNLSALEKYYKKIANKYSKLNHYYLGKCQHSHFFPSWGISQSPECTKINQELTKFKTSFVSPIEDEITRIRKKLPFLSVPLSGGEFGSSSCFTGIVDDFASKPLSFFIYGHLTPIAKAVEYRSISKELHYDTNCGTPAWKGGVNTGQFSYNIDESSLSSNFSKEYEDLRKITHPNALAPGQYPDISVLNDIIQKEFNTSDPNAEKNKFDKFMESYRSQPPVTENEIDLARKLKVEADLGIEDAFLSTLKDACDDPIDYGSELLTNDTIGKLYFEKNNLDLEGKELFCQTRSNFLQDEERRDQLLMDAAIGVGILGFVHPVVALAVLPIEFGLEYAQYSEMQSDRRRNISLALFGLEDYRKIEEDISSLQSEELIFYGVLATMALGGVGDVIDGIATVSRLWSREQRVARQIARDLDKAIETFTPAGKAKVLEFKKQIQAIQASGASELEKRLQIIDAYHDLERTLPPNEFLKISEAFGENVNAMKKLAAEDIKHVLAREFAQNDLSMLIDDIASLESMDEIELLLSSYRKAKSSPDEMTKFLELLKRRKISCGV